MSQGEIRSSRQIRTDFLDFFKSKTHTIVPSSSLLPDSPNLLFTNAGMNQFVPIFLGQQQCPYRPPRAADTQKCIRAGGKHNDLDDVGLDTYHHTFFEMLGNWSFGDYFKKEAIEWAWELVVQVWKFPPQRIYATVYNPDKSRNDLPAALRLAQAGPSEFDQEAWNYWAEKFRSVGLDPAVHIVNGNKKDNFWMMGETGPCGPCSELHVDLTPAGDTKGSLVNQSDARCIEIWNLVFIQFNANPDGTFSPLPAKHVDTGMGFERVTSILQCTKNFTDFNATISNYETDIFRPIFDVLEKLSGKHYGSTLPGEHTRPRVLQSAPSPIASEASGTSEAKYSGRKEEASRDVEHSAPTAGAQSAAREGACAPHATEQIAVDVAFRVIADHIRTLSFAIADGIQPGNNDRNYVLRRILRRAVRYGRTLGFHEPFFFKLVDVLAETMGDVFPEIRARKKQVQETIRVEEEAFNKTLDRGIELFNEFIQGRRNTIASLPQTEYVVSLLTERIERKGVLSPRIPKHDSDLLEENISWARPRAYGKAVGILFNTGKLDLTSSSLDQLPEENLFKALYSVRDLSNETRKTNLSEEQFQKLVDEIRDRLGRVQVEISSFREAQNQFPGGAAFILYDTYGFPVDLTSLMCREIGFDLDVAGFEELMQHQRTRARAAQKKEVISLSQIKTTTPTKFVGFDKLETDAKVVEVVSLKDKTAVILDTSACYAEMGGQVGDTGEIIPNSVAAGVSLLTSQVRADSPPLLRVTNTQKSGNTWLHLVEGENIPAVGDEVLLTVDRPRRNAIQRHHTVTHLFHWALHEVISREASQKGSYVGPEKLTFDFNSAVLTHQQITDIEKLVNERILENALVSWTEVPHTEIRNRKDILQFFGEKYGDTVRVVQIGGERQGLNGYSMELCGGTHTRATGEIGLFRIVSESAVAAGIRRVEAIAGLTAYLRANEELQMLRSVAGKINSPVAELEKKLEAMLAHQKELEKQIKASQQKQAAENAKTLIGKATTIQGIPTLIQNLGSADGDALQSIADALKNHFKGVVVLGGVNNGAVSLVASVSPEFTAKVQAGKIIQTIAPIVGGKGGGRPDNARGGGKDVSKLDEALAKAASMIG